MTIAKTITEARRARGWSPSQLAAELRVTACYIEQLENGDFNPSRQMAELLGSVLCVPAQLFHDVPPADVC